MSALNYITKLIGKIKIPLPRMNQIKVAKIKDSLFEGDCILSYTSGSFSNLWIKGKYKHVGIYVGNDYIVEAVFKGVVSTHINDFCFKKDNIAIIRPATGSTIKNRLDVVKRAMKIIGAKYDFDYVRGGDTFYCSEVIEECWGELVTVPVRKILGKTVLIPSDLIGHKEWVLIKQV